MNNDYVPPKDKITHIEAVLQLLNFFSRNCVYRGGFGCSVLFYLKIRVDILEHSIDKSR